MTVAPPSAHTGLAQQWASVLEILKREIGNTAYRTWLEPLRFDQLDGDRVVMSVPTKFLRDWVVSHYADRMRALWAAVNPSVRRIVIEVRAADGASPGLSPETVAEMLPRTDAARRFGVRSESYGRGTAGGISDEVAEEMLDVGAPLDPAYTFENFVVGKPNEFAFAAAKRVAESAETPFNPLFLYGGVGLGKTHLMHAIAWQIRRGHPHRRVIYLSAEKFMYQFIKSLRQQDTLAFKDLFRSTDVLMVDDVQFISGKESTQEEFFHTFNALVDHGRQIVISADRSPADLSGLEERIRSRLGWGLVADIHPTTYELRLGILQQKAERIRAQQQVAVPDRVMEFIAHRITSNVRDLEGALNRVVLQASLVAREITIDMASDVLQDLLRANDKRVTIEDIQKRVAEHYQLKVSDLTGARRARNVARPRQLAMYLAKQLTQRSLPEIGRKFGNRDHTTVMYAIKKIDELCLTDAGLSGDLDSLKRVLQG